MTRSRVGLQHVCPINQLIIGYTISQTSLSKDWDSEGRDNIFGCLVNAVNLNWPYIPIPGMPNTVVDNFTVVIMVNGMVEASFKDIPEIFEV